MKPTRKIRWHTSHQRCSKMWQVLSQPASKKLMRELLPYQRSSLCCRPPCGWWEMQSSTITLWEDRTSCNNLRKVMTEIIKILPWPFFGKDFSQKAKEKLDDTEALRKVIYQPESIGKQNFQGGYLLKQSWCKEGGHQNSFSPGKCRKRSGGNTSTTPAEKLEGGKSWLKTIDNVLLTPHVQISINPVKLTPVLTLKGVDNPEGHAHKSGRESLPLCSQLGTGYPIPMGPAGYLLELTQTLHQVRQTQIWCLQEKQIKISQEVGELLAKGDIIKAQLFPLSFVWQIFLSEKKGEARVSTTLWGWSTSKWKSSRRNPTDRLDAEAGPQRCILAAGCGSSGNLSSDLLGWHTHNAPFRDRTHIIGFPRVQTIWSSRPNCQPGEIPRQEMEFLGFQHP